MCIAGLSRFNRPFVPSRTQPTRPRAAAGAVDRFVSMGIEVEMQNIALPKARSVVFKGLPGAQRRTERGVIDSQDRLWEVKLDGGGRAGDIVELASPILTSLDDVRTTQTLSAALAEQGAMSTARTGVHLHVDAREEAMTVPHMVRLVGMAARYEADLYHTLGVSPARRDRYCLPMEQGRIAALLRDPPADRETLCRAYRGALPDRDRGLNVDNITNFKNKITMEFRYFDGTLEAPLIGAYASLVQGMVRHALAGTEPPSPHSLARPGTVPELLEEIGLPTLQLRKLGGVPHASRE